jgi:hypothetical protein
MSGMTAKMGRGWRRTPGSATSIVALATAGFLAVGVLVQAVALGFSVARDTFALDYRLTYLPAGQALIDGRSPYPEYGYPPLVAFLSAPFALLPSHSELVFGLVLALCVPAGLWVSGVRDWRCYAAAFCWAPVFHAIQTGNVTLLLFLGAAVCWQFRDSPAGGAAGGLTVAAKLITWPLALWFATMRRWAALGAFVGTAVGVTVGLWAALGFSGLREYARSLGDLADQFAPAAYTFEALALDLGVSESVASALGLGVLAVCIAGVVWFGSRRDDARSYACAMTAAIFVSPIVWLHSFALLLAPLAVLRPRFSPVWLLPAVGWIHTGNGNGSPLETAVTLGACLLAVALALIPPGAIRRASFPKTLRAAARDGREPGVAPIDMP